MVLMKILVIDRDRTSLETVESLCSENDNIDLTVETTKNAAMERLKNERFDAIFIDPAPQNDELRPFIIGMRRMCEAYTPIIVTSHKLDEADAKKAGAADILPKPIDRDVFCQLITNIQSFSLFYKKLNDETDHFPSADGVISKPAFNQIFISCLDRADRYGDKTFLMFTRIENIDDIRQKHGPEIANDLCDKLKYYTTKTRRLSDIAGRTGANEICLMLLRPNNDEEPMLAVERLSESIKGCHNLIAVDDVSATVSVSLMAIPSGEILFKKDHQ